MSKERFDAIISLLQMLGLIAGGVIVLAKWAKAWQASVSEKSVGATKVKELEKTASEVHEDIRTLKQNSEICKKEILKLQDDYERLIDHIWDLLGKK